MILPLQANTILTIIIIVILINGSPSTTQATLRNLLCQAPEIVQVVSPHLVQNARHEIMQLCAHPGNRSLCLCVG